MSLSASRTLRGIMSTVGTPIYERGSNGEMNTIDGYPYTICQRFTAAASVAASTRWGVFGDFRRALLFGLLQDVQIASSDQAAFRNDQTLIRGLAHFDVAYQDANALVVMIAGTA
jgi:HK97 family phage major capsid protein